MWVLPTQTGVLRLDQGKYQAGGGGRVDGVTAWARMRKPAALAR